MKNVLCLMLVTLAIAARGEATKPFPAHWGEPPGIQTRDYRPLPDGYGFGSSTLANWIQGNLAKDAQAAGPAPATGAKPVYACDFSDLPDGPLPESFMVIQGEFTVKSDGTNKLLELPGAPVDSHSVLFGPVTNAGVAIDARILATSRGRRMPTFGVGTGGVAGYKLQIAPAKGTVELQLDTQVVKSVPYEWKSGAWTQCKLRIRKTGEATWVVEAKAWDTSGPEPANWMITHETKESPINGQASVLGSPFSGTPIQFDDLKVSGVR